MGMKREQWSAENLTFGCGGGLLQKHNRDTLKCAFKCSYAVINGEGINVYKDPITDHGKLSKKGKLTLEMEDGKYVTKTEGAGCQDKNLLVAVFKNGELLIDYNLDDIRERAKTDVVNK